MRREKIAAVFREAGLGEYLSGMEPLMKSAIRPVLDPREDEGEIPLGASKIGGHPDLPIEPPWPVVDGVLLEFVGQFRMEEVSALDETGLLPREGLLSFFFDGMLTGYEIGEVRDRCKVLYITEPVEALQRLEVPSHEYGRSFHVYWPCALRFQKTLTLPTGDEIDNLSHRSDPPTWPSPFANSEEFFTYEGLRYQELWDPATQFLGHVAGVQSGERYVALQDRDMARYLVLRKRENREAYVQALRDLVLLFSSATQPGSDISWGTGGIVYFWIEKKDLLARNFDGVSANLFCA